jgi:glycerophosphoryl diester phosphodiesterase
MQHSNLGFGREGSGAGVWQKRFYRIGHSGAAGHAPANTLKSLALALEIGVDIVEFDVRACRDGLVLIHDATLEHVPSPYGARAVRDCTVAELQALTLEGGERIPTLVEALELLRGAAGAHRVPFNLDLKEAGCEARVVAALCELGALEQALISSTIPTSLAAVRAVSPVVKIGLSYPEDRGNASKRALLKPAVDGAVWWMRQTLPRRVLGMMAQAGANAVMLNHRVVSQQVVEVVHRCQGRVFVWTVDDVERLQQVYALGVDGIASNYPELFQQLPPFRKDGAPSNPGIKSLRLPR